MAVAATETVSSSGVLAVSVNLSGLAAWATNIDGSHRAISKSLLSHIQLIGVITEQPQRERCGIIEIQFDETFLLFSNKNTISIKFIDELKKSIQFDTHAKKWLYHVRRDEACRKAQKSLNSLYGHLPDASTGRSFSDKVVI
ncbi:TPA: hypothetical protein R8F93_000826 [Enterobacter soli]|nr:hypothetical protein [Enterobacter soli]